MYGLASLGAVLLAAVAVILAGLDNEAQWDPLLVPAHYPEGPVLIGGRLFYAEMTAGRITRIEGEDIVRLAVPDDCGPTSVSPFGEGRIVVTCHLGGGLILMSEEGEIERKIETDTRGTAITYPNDCHADGRGGVYFSSSGPFAFGAQPAGRLFHLRSDGSVREVASDLTYPNGVFTDPDGVLFVSEHLGKRILRYRIEANGDLSELEPFATHETLGLKPPGEDAYTGPDGIEVASDGRVFVAIYGAGKVLVLDADGIVTDDIPAPMPFLTNIVLDEAGSRAFLAGAFDNRTWPYEGQVMQVDLP